LVWDFTRADTFCTTYMLNTARQPGAAARVSETEKKPKYAFLEDRFLFVLVAIGTLEVYGAEAVKFIFGPWVSA